MVLVGTGPRERTDAEVLRQAAGRGVKAAQRLRARSVAMAVPGDPGESLGPVAEGAALGAYRFDQYRTEGREERVALEVGPAAPPRRRGALAGPGGGAGAGAPGDRGGELRPDPGERASRTPHARRRWPRRPRGWRRDTGWTSGSAGRAS